MFNYSSIEHPSSCLVFNPFTELMGEFPRGVMVKAMDFGIVAFEFGIQSRYYVHFH